MSAWGLVAVAASPPPPPPSPEGTLRVNLLEDVKMERAPIPPILPADQAELEAQAEETAAMTAQYRARQMVTLEKIVGLFQLFLERSSVSHAAKERGHALLPKILGLADGDTDMEYSLFTGLICVKWPVLKVALAEDPLAAAVAAQVVSHAIAANKPWLSRQLRERGERQLEIKWEQARRRLTMAQEEELAAEADLSMLLRFQEDTLVRMKQQREAAAREAAAKAHKAEMVDAIAHLLNPEEGGGDRAVPLAGSLTTFIELFSEK
jgi:hypothetical protein